VLFWLDNEMVEFASGMWASQSIRGNLRECEDQSWFKVQAVPCFVLIDVRCFHVPLRRLRLPSEVHVPQVEDHWSRRIDGPHTSGMDNTGQYKHTDIHSLSGTRTHNHSVCFREDSSCLRPVYSILFYSRTHRCNFSSTCYSQSYWCPYVLVSCG
jgi:hypothetical protein